MLAVTVPFETSGRVPGETGIVSDETLVLQALGYSRTIVHIMFYNN